MQVADIFEKASGRLPMVPKVVQELINSLNRPEFIDFGEIVYTLAHDPVLSARLLRLANTPRFGGSRKIGSLNEALIILGFDNLRVLIIASGIINLNLHVPHLDLKNFWHTSFERGNTAKYLAKLAQQNPQLSFSCGLFSNIGILVLHIALPDVANTIEQGSRAGQERLAIEQALLDIDTAQIGAELLRRWNFPEALLEAVEWQHRAPAFATPLAAIVHLSRLMVEQFDSIQNDTLMPHLELKALLDRLGLTAEIYAETFDTLRHTRLLDFDFF